MSDGNTNMIKRGYLGKKNKMAKSKQKRLFCKCKKVDGTKTVANGEDCKCSKGVGKKTNYKFVALGENLEI